MASYNTNTNVSYPGPGWEVLWPQQFDNFQLDIVGFLAILGESSILANAQVSALSSLNFLPRLLPAPQALLRVTRPDTLPPTRAWVTSVTQGNKKEHIHHVASILLGTRSSELPKHSVRCVNVRKRILTQAQQNQRGPTFVDKVFRGLSKTQDAQNDNPATVKAKAAGPLTWVTMTGVSLTVTIFIASWVYGDGMSLMATVSLSLLSSVCGLANKWQLSLTKPPRTGGKEPPEDTVVIRYPIGSFLVVKCNDEVARELFFAPEELNYYVKKTWWYRVLALVGSIMLMVGVILLANATLQLQFAWAGSYLILNAAHWAAAALPARMHWDLSCYELEEEGIEKGPYNSSFTDALWKVILLTKDVKWVRQGEAAPNTAAWDMWTKEASHAAKLAPDPLHDHELDSPCKTWPGHRTHGIVHQLPKPPHEFDARQEFRKCLDSATADERKRQEEDDQGIQLERMAQAQAQAGAQQRFLPQQNGNAG